MVNNELPILPVGTSKSHRAIYGFIMTGGIIVLPIILIFKKNTKLTWCAIALTSPRIKNRWCVHIVSSYPR